jgi:uncharacterized membrane protein
MSDQVGERPSRFTLIRRIIQAGITRLCEIGLAVIGINYIRVPNTAARETGYLLSFDLLALVYLTVGFFVVRQHRHQTAGPPPPIVELPPWARRLRRQFSFILAAVASVTGIAAALDVLFHGTPDEQGTVIKILGVIAVVCAWLLLHVGYAKFYRSLDVADGSPGLRFPDNIEPLLLDYLYFALTLGVSFAVSDVEIIRRDTRWHVLVHSVASFFYNSAVLAVAVGVVTQK